MWVYIFGFKKAHITKYLKPPNKITLNKPLTTYTRKPKPSNYVKNLFFKFQFFNMYNSWWFKIQKIINTFQNSSSIITMRILWEAQGYVCLFLCYGFCGKHGRFWNACVCRRRFKKHKKTTQSYKIIDHCRSSCSCTQIQHYRCSDLLSGRFVGRVAGAPNQRGSERQMWGVLDLGA